MSHQKALDLKITEAATVAGPRPEQHTGRGTACYLGGSRIGEFAERSPVEPAWHTGTHRSARGVLVLAQTPGRRAMQPPLAAQDRRALFLLRPGLPGFWRAVGVPTELTACTHRQPRFLPPSIAPGV